MKIIRVSFIILAVYILAAGCVASNETSSQQENQRISVLKNLKLEDVKQIELLNHTLTKKEDIAICLTGLKSITIIKKSDVDVSSYKNNDFILLLKNGKKITIKFAYNVIVIDNITYTYDEHENPITSGHVILTSQGKTYEAYESEVCGLDYAGTRWDGVFFEPWATEYQSEAEEMAAITYEDDFVIDCIWDYNPEIEIAPFYTVYDDKSNKISDMADEFSIPGRSGTYYLEIQLSWGTDYRFDSYQYIFKIIKN